MCLPGQVASCKPKFVGQAFKCCIFMNLRVCECRCLTVSHFKVRQGAASYRLQSVNKELVDEERRATGCAPPASQRGDQPFFPLINIIRFPICVGFKSRMLPNGCFCFTLRQQILCHHLAGQLAVLSSGQKQNNTPDIDFKKSKSTGKAVGK